MVRDAGFSLDRRGGNGASSGHFAQFTVLIFCGCLLRQGHSYDDFYPARLHVVLDRSKSIDYVLSGDEAITESRPSRLSSILGMIRIRDLRISDISLEETKAGNQIF